MAVCVLQNESVSTSGNLSRTSLIFSPFCPMMVRWNFCSMIRSFVRSFSYSVKNARKLQTLNHADGLIMPYRMPLFYHLVRLTIRWAMSISSLRASCTPWGSPSIRTNPQRSESWGILTDTLYCSFIRFTREKHQRKSIIYSFVHLLRWLIKTLP